MNYPKNLEDKIGFNTLRTLLEKYCECELGVSYIQHITFCTDVNIISSQLNETVEMNNIRKEEDDFPTPSFTHALQQVRAIKTVGTFIQAADLFKLVKSLIDIYNLCKFFEKKQETYSVLFSKAKNIYVPEEVFEYASKILDKHGNIKDNASPELADIRRSISTKKNQLNKTMAQLLSKARKEGWTDSDTEVSMRNGRLVIPVHAAHKRKFKGLVHDESATGKTYFVEPAEVIETHNAIANLEFEEQKEIIKILIAVTDQIRPFIPNIEEAYVFLGEIDAIRAKSKLADYIDAGKPQISNKQIIDLKQAKHPLLTIQFKETNRSVVPLRIKLDNNQRILIISGPNAGGKSVCMKSVALLQYMFQCGLLVPCNPTSTMGIFNQIFIDIGDEQSLENDLSTYSSHLVTMKHFLDFADKKTLIFIDEFGTGTEPLLGGAIAESVLESLHNKMVYGLITTHYTNLKHIANSLQFAENAAMLFDSENMCPLYKLRIGTPGSSFAFEIARTIGIPKDILDKAKNKIGKEHVDFDKNLKALEAEKQYVFRKKDDIVKQQEQLRKLEADYKIKLQNITAKQSEIIKEAKREIEDIITESNKQVEKTIRQIKESQADKEKTKELREKLKQQQENTVNRISNKEKKQPKHSVQPKAADSNALQIGDYVTLDNQTEAGLIVEINKKQAVVEFGHLKSFVDLKRLTKTKKPKGKAHKPLISSVSQDIAKRQEKFSHKLDVRGKQADDALYEVQDFIENALVLRVSKVEILRGKGYGILRKLIREYLDTQNFIAGYSDAPINQGGDGITLVNIEL